MMRTLMAGAYLVPLGGVNSVLLVHAGQVTVIDTGFPGNEKKILTAVRQLGFEPAEVSSIVFTHAHPDHIGSGAALQRFTGARTFCHDFDRAIAESGGPFRPMVPGKGVLQKALYHLFWRPEKRVDPVLIDHSLPDGAELPIAGGVRVIHVPGHCAGQVALLWQKRLLVVADAMTNFLRPGDPLGFEEIAEGRRSQQKLIDLALEVIAFMHGRPILSDAKRRLHCAVASSGTRT